jgi:hypothetical protein
MNWTVIPLPRLVFREFRADDFEQVHAFAAQMRTKTFGKLVGQ